MENESFIFDPVVNQVICRHRERVEHLFDVQLTVSQYDTSTNQVNEVSSCQVVARSSRSQENVGKAKRYLQALIADGPQFSIKAVNYDLDVVREILHIKSDLEKEFCTVILANEGMTTVSIKGHRQDVDRCKQFTDDIRQRLSDLQHDVQLGEQFEQLTVNDGLDVQNQNNSCNGAVASSNLSLNDSNCEEFEDEIVDIIKNDPGYQTKLEFAVKLGYTEPLLIEVLKTLDKDTDQNELLSELVRYSSSRPDSGDDIYYVDTVTNADVNIQATKKKLSADDDNSPFRHIIMDGSNVAMSHGNKELFSCRGIQLAVDWFRERGHTCITVFVPQWRKETSRSDSRIRDQHILNELEREKVLVFTPSRRIGGKRVICYDDRYILKLAVETDGIVVSNDNYRDLINENELFKKVVEERLLMFSFVNDRFMPPDDPLGRNGPTLDNFLLKEPAEPEPLPPPCPYGSKKCTFGNKCKYYHPERRTNPHKSVTEKLAEQAKLQMQEIRQRQSPTQSLEGKKKLTRTKTPLQKARSLNPDDLKRRKQLEETTMSGTDPSMASLSHKTSDTHTTTVLDHSIEEQDSHSKTITRQETPEKKDKGSKSIFGDIQEGKSSPRYTDVKQTGWNSPRGSSPVNLTVPGLTDQREDGQKFLSGHLLLAKKLSDEASESDKIKKKNKSKPDDNFTSPLAYTPNLSETGGKKPLTRSSEKQKLSRQLSLQGGEDPRLSKGHSSLHTALSYDSRTSQGQQLHPTPVSNMAERQMLLQDFMNVQHRDMQSDSGRPKQKETLHKTLSRDVTKSHTPVSRMQSAPDRFRQVQSTVRPMINRQNSSSDTQLNKLHSCESDPHNVDIIPGKVPSEAMPSKDSTGNLSFQIGGPVGNQLSRCQPFSTPSQSFTTSLISPQEYQRQQAATSNYQQPSPYYHHQQNQQNHQQQQQLQFSHGPNFQQLHQSNFPSHQTNHPYQGTVDQSNVWNAQTHLLQSVSNFPSQFSGGNIFPHNVISSETNISALGISGSHGYIQPFPTETPILPNNPRFKLYHDLCNLFPEESVRTVMNQHPDLNNAKDLCAYLIKN